MKSKTPLMGLVVGMVLVFWSINQSGDLSSFYDFPSIVITVFGSFSALVISFPIKSILKIPIMIKKLISSPPNNRKELVTIFTDLARKARKDGLLALEDDISAIDNEFLVSGLQMVIDGVEPDNIKEIMESKLDALEDRHRSGQAVFSKWGEFAPAFGMIGTLIGLVVMLAELEDPSTIGSGMSVALITTFYGSLLANMIFIPIASNLAVQTDEEIYTGEMIIDGVLAIQRGSNPRVVEDKLLTYLSPAEKKELANAADVSKEATSYE